MGKALGNHILLVDKTQAHIQPKRTFHILLFIVLKISFSGLDGFLFRMAVTLMSPEC